jgi:aspartate/methionine/tyrosine aminotransferase
MRSRHVATKVAKINSSPTVSLPDKARELKSSGVDVIDLSEGQPHFDTPPPIKEAAKAALDAGFVFYVQSAGLPELRSEIRTKLLRENGMDIPVSQIMVTVGAKQAIFTAMLCTIDEGDEVLIPDPYWGSHVSIVELMGGKPISVPMKREKGFAIDVKLLEDSVTSKTKMVVLSSPHNPTGMVASRDDVEAIADLCKRKDVLVLADEIYEKLTYDGARHYSVGSIAGMEDLAITVNGFSKPYSMTGWRLGYVAAPKDIMEKMLIVQQHSVTHPSAFVQKAGVVALRDCGKYVDEMVRDYEAARNYFVAELNKLDYLRCEMPRGAFYAFPKIIRPSTTSDLLCDLMLEKANVLAVPGSGFGNCGEGYVRFVYAQTKDTLEKTVNSLKKIN